MWAVSSQGMQDHFGVKSANSLAGRVDLFIEICGVLSRIWVNFGLLLRIQEPVCNRNNGM